MATQPEQILEEQLVAQLQKLGYGLEHLFVLTSLIFNLFENLTLRMFTEFKKGISFAPTVLATLKSERTAYQGESFAFIGFTENNNTPPMSLSGLPEYTLRGFFHIICNIKL